MPTSISVAAFVFGVIFLAAAIIGRDVKIITVEIPASEGSSRILIGIFGIVLIIIGFITSDRQVTAPPPVVPVTSVPPTASPTLIVTQVSPTPSAVAILASSTPTFVQTATMLPNVSYKVLLDTYHGIAPFSWNGSDRIKLEKRGFAFTLQTGEYSIEELKKYDAVVISYSCGSGRAFSESYIKSIQDYISQGGSVYLIGIGWCWFGEHPGKSIEDYPLNKMLSGSGISFTKNIIRTYDGMDYNQYPITFNRSCMVDHPITMGVNSIAGAKAAPGTLSVRDQAIALILAPSNSTNSDMVEKPILYAVSSDGNGKVAVIGHPSYTYSFVDTYATGEFNPSAYDNYKLLENTLLWLVQK